jgi:hypothetical protein
MAYSVIHVGKRVVLITHKDGSTTNRALVNRSSANILGSGWLSMAAYRAAFPRG